MSRIGNKPITVPAEVKVTIDGHKITVTGPKGTLEREIHENISLEMNDNTIKVSRINDEAANRSLHGLTRTLINNMIIGVTQEYTKELQINGVGYRVAKQGTGLNLTLGYSHPVIFEAPEGITFDVPNPNTIIVRGIDKEVVSVGVFSRVEIWSKERYLENNDFDDMDEIAEHMAELGIGI